MVDDEKSRKRAARQACEAAERHKERGDFAEARRQYAAIAGQYPGTEASQIATRELAAMTLDVWAIRAGLFVLLLILLGWFASV